MKGKRFFFQECSKIGSPSSSFHWYYRFLQHTFILVQSNCLNLYLSANMSKSPQMELVVPFYVLGEDNKRSKEHVNSKYYRQKVKHSWYISSLLELFALEWSFWFFWQVLREKLKTKQMGTSTISTKDIRNELYSSLQCCYCT